MSFQNTVWIELPEAEMRVAVQEYLDARFKKSPGTVTTVVWSGVSQVFRVRVDSEEEKSNG